MTDDPQILDPGIDSIGSSCEWLKQRLQEEGVAVHPGSGLAKGFGAISALHQAFLAGPVLNCSLEELYSLWTPAVGIDFLSKAVQRAWEAGLRPPKHLWKALASSDPNVFHVAGSTKERNQVWELLIASLCMRFCDGVIFEEPDVVCDFEGLRVNVSMKVAYKEKKLWFNALKGFKQAKNQAGDLDVVVVNVVALMPVHELLRGSVARRFTDPAALESWVMNWATVWCEGRELTRLHADIEGQVKRPVTVAFFMPILATIGEEPNPIGVFYIHAPLTTNGKDYEFVRCLLHACNTTLNRVDGAN